MNRVFKFVLIISLFFVLAACKIKVFTSANKDVNIQGSFQPEPGQVAIIESNIIINKPLSNDVVFSPLEIAGRARVFEGNILFRLKDNWGKVVATSTTTALAGAPDWGFYSGKLTFDLPTTPIGSLEVWTLSPKDGSEQNLIRLPIRFKEYKKPIIKVYFNNIEADQKLTDCRKVYPVEREVGPENSPIVSAIDELLKGLTDKDKNNGFITNIPEKDVKLQKLELKDNIAYIDFNPALQAGVAGSCKVNGIRAQITETLKQFPEIKDVVISIEGKTEGVL